MSDTDINSIDLLAYLRRGWELTNRGTGWFVAEKQIHYKRSKSFKVGDDVVCALEKEGFIKCEIPYNSIKATLIEDKG